MSRKLTLKEKQDITSQFPDDELLVRYWMHITECMEDGRIDDTLMVFLNEMCFRELIELEIESA